MTRVMSEPMTSEGLEELVREHAALRRVATLVARLPSPCEVFAAVRREVGMLVGAQPRLVETADEARPRIERDLHDGAQQQFVAAALELTVLEQRLARDPHSAGDVVGRVREQIDRGLTELRDLGDRVEAVGGRLEVDSVRGRGTRL